MAHTGDQAPDTPSGVTYSSFSSLVLNDADHIAFYAGLSGSGVDSTNNGSIWSESSAGLALVARKGDQAPGTPNGVVFGNVGGYSGLVLNGAGQIAFYSDLTENGVDVGGGIWATDRNGELQLIARDGDLLEVAPGDFRTVDLGLHVFTPTGNSDGRVSFFNNLGQLAFRAEFTDFSSGIFVSNRVAIPEPSTFVLAAVIVLGLIVRPVRRNSARQFNARADRIV